MLVGLVGGVSSPRCTEDGLSGCFVGPVRDAPNWFRQFLGTSGHLRTIQDLRYGSIWDVWPRSWQKWCKSCRDDLLMISFTVVRNVSQACHVAMWYKQRPRISGQCHDPEDTVREAAVPELRVKIVEAKCPVKNLWRSCCEQAKKEFGSLELNSLYRFNIDQYRSVMLCFTCLWVCWSL